MGEHCPAQANRTGSKFPKQWLLPSSMTENPPATPIGVNDATSPPHRLATSEVSSTQLLTAFCKKAAIAHQLTNRLTEMFFEEGIARAKALDEHL
ncbi:hypothetical protein N7524_012106 [Penicillium chrysogenum]|nr:hypothetical protein N7524_012106 [Penicillium chrysogenum]